MQRPRRKVWNRLAAVLASSALLAVGVAACEETGLAQEPGRSGNPLGPVAFAAMGWGGLHAAPDEGEQTAEAKGSAETWAPIEARAERDAEIAYAVATLARAEIVQGLLARARASDPRVRELAEQAISKHVAALESYNQTLWQLGLHPERGPLGLELERRALVNTASLSRLWGSDFDAAYLASRLEFRETTTSLFSSQLLPNATAGAHRRGLDDILPTLSSQLRLATDLEAELDLLPDEPLEDSAPDEPPPDELTPENADLDEPGLDEAAADGTAPRDREFEDPEFEDPEFEDPEFEDPEFEDPEFENPEYQDPEFEDPEFEDPEFQDPEYQDPEFQDPEFEAPAR